jgi:hypothetical protein
VPGFFLGFERIIFMSKKEIPPSVSETAFCCPHCGAFTTQYWFELARKPIKGENAVPLVLTQRKLDKLLNDMKENEAARESIEDWGRKLVSGEMFCETKGDYEWRVHINNLCLNECYNCKKFSLWVYDKLVFPSAKGGIEPNSDLPGDIVRDFEEARTIVNESPRGAAAILRLCVQKLCVHLGEKGKHIDEDIASLVVKGLDPLIQKSLDIVRVIGNEAVHPGVIDLSDDRDTANKLFGLINLIADQMITRPKNVHALYDKLPEAKKAAIEKRDGKK